MKTLLVVIGVFLSGCATSQLEESIQKNREETVEQINILHDEVAIQKEAQKAQQNEIKSLKEKIDALTEQLKAVEYKLTQPRLISNDDLPLSETSEKNVDDLLTPEDKPEPDAK